ncbi:MAG: macro domain-containing protein [Candidatus Zixiibacteriota bacterium]
MQKRLGKIEIKLIQGDITEQEFDAIVNAANNHLWMGVGVAGAIKRKGGVEIEQEAMSKGPIPVGEAVVTGAGSLKAKYVIHAAVMGQDLKTSEEHIRNGTLNALKRAEELKIKSIAFPAFGTGVGGFPADECARIMFNAVKDFSQEAEFVEEVRFVLFDKASYDVWSVRL